MPEGTVTASAETTLETGAEGALSYDDPKEDPLIKELEDEVRKRTNFDGQVSNAVQNGRTAMGDSAHEIWDRVNRREELQAYSRLTLSHPEQAENYARRWTDLVRKYPEIRPMPTTSWSNEPTVMEWSKKNGIELPRNLDICRDIASAFERHRRDAEEQSRLEADREAINSRNELSSQIVGINKRELNLEQSLATTRSELSMSPLEKQQLVSLPSYTGLEEQKDNLEAQLVELRKVTRESYNEETENSYTRESPTLEDFWEESDGERPSDERKGMEELADFIDRTIETAKQASNQELYEEALEYRKNFTFIGEKEFIEAERAMAETIAEEVRNGKTVFLYPFGNRSEKFVTINILKQLDGMLSDEEKKKVIYSENRILIGRQIAKLKDKAVLFMPDDFVLSGSRMKSVVEASVAELTKLGLTKKEIKSIIRPMAMVASDEDYKFSRTLNESKEGDDVKIGLSMYFKKKPFKGHPTGAVSGAHCSTDYGFESTLERYQKFMMENGRDVPLPKLANIKRPYELVENSSVYKDSQLQLMYGELAGRYALRVEI